MINSSEETSGIFEAICRPSALEKKRFELSGSRLPQVQTQDLGRTCKTPIGREGIGAGEAWQERPRV